MTSGKSVHSSSLLPASFEHQDERFATAFSILQKAIADRVFPAASVAVAHAGKLVALKAFGHFTYDPDDRATEQTSGTPGLADFARRGTLRSTPPLSSTSLPSPKSLPRLPWR